eukprot:TRINITY_DN23415_c0_g2_i1.p1 TRINITY_DN23415_c0_g2~~TRINITY_DN23415_c0_g2_i1.p1  ORF type:complete len:311 (+),score=21.46 TRINITY_DN23415_c0_g2_i1:111-935(+)
MVKMEGLWLLTTASLLFEALGACEDDTCRESANATGLVQLGMQKAGDKASDAGHFFFTAPGSSVLATFGYVTLPFKVSATGDYVFIPDGNRNRHGWLKFKMSCRSKTTVNFQLEMTAHDGNSDSVFLQLDASSKWTWHTGRGGGAGKFGASRTSKTYTASSGDHLVTLSPRESGIKIRALRILSGAAHCQLLHDDPFAEAPTILYTAMTGSSYQELCFGAKQGGQSKDQAQAKCTVDPACKGIWNKGTDSGPWYCCSGRPQPLATTDTWVPKQD